MHIKLHVLFFLMFFSVGSSFCMDVQSDRQKVSFADMEEIAGILGETIEINKESADGIRELYDFFDSLSPEDIQKRSRKDAFFSDYSKGILHVILAAVGIFSFYLFYKNFSKIKSSIVRY